MADRIQCPSCGKSLFERPVSRPTIARPFVACPHCKALVAQEHCNEWALLGPAQRARHLGRVVFAALGFGLISALAYVARAALSRSAPEPSATALVFLAGALLAGGIAGTRLALRIRRSRHRLTDPMYRSALVEFELQASGQPR